MSPSSPENGDFPSRRVRRSAGSAGAAGGPRPVAAARTGARGASAPSRRTMPPRRRPGRTGRAVAASRPLVVKVAVFVAVAALAMLLAPGVRHPALLGAGGRDDAHPSSGRPDPRPQVGPARGPVRRGEIVVFRPPRSLPCTVVGGRGGDLCSGSWRCPATRSGPLATRSSSTGGRCANEGWYDPRFGQVGSTPIRSTTLAPGQYFVMADNRSDACDSRVFGPISKSSMVGEGIAIVGRHGHVYFGSL